MNNSKTIAIIAIIIIAALSRLIPHPANFAPLGAMALFGGHYLTKKWHSFAVAAGSWWLADLVLNNTIYKAYYPTFTWFSGSFIAVSISLIAIIFISKAVIKKPTFGNIALGSFLGSLAFFLITNFAVFLGNMYPHTNAGLVAAYTAGLPFFKNTVIGDLLYSGLLFGAYQFVQSQFKLTPSAVKNS
jgi:hypothetical protein